MNNKPIKIYLGDLTYDTITVSTNNVPLNIGYIASYCIKRFGSKVEIILFKYINEIEQAILKSPPDILGLSNYCWNQNIGSEMFSLLHKENPNALSVWGGPNFPKDRLSQEKWLNEFPEVDVYITEEGEIGFANIVENVLKIRNQEKIRSSISAKPVDSCIVRNKDGNYQFSNTSERIRNLEDIPSPYLTRLMDKFFDGQLDPIIQTSRGCPFKCTYCVDGSHLVNKVNRYNLERIKKELEYIAQHVPDKITTLGISDLNFGMHKGDLEICDAIIEIQKRYNYPHIVGAATGKNSKERIIETIKRLSGSLVLTLSVQSMDKQVLNNIKRDNISEKDIIDLAPTIKNSGLQTKAEVILGLPGDNYEAHTYTLKSLLDAEIDEILVFSCMLLPGSELYPHEERKKWNLKSKHRILPRDFAKLSNGKIILETEEVVVGTEQMTFDEYVKLRVFNFILRVTSTDKVYSPLKKFLKEQNIKLFDLVEMMLKNIENAPDSIKDICKAYRRSTIDELWDSAEELIANYQQESEYKKLLDGRAGINVLYHYQALVMVSCMKEWTEYIFATLKDLLNKKQQFNEAQSRQFNDIVNYSLGISFNPLGKNRMSINPKYEFNYNITEWLNNNAKLSLSSFKFSSNEEIEFRFTEDQFNTIQNRLAQFDDNIISISKALFTGTIIPSHFFWRNPFIVDKYNEKKSQQDLSQLK